MSAVGKDVRTNKNEGSMLNARRFGVSRRHALNLKCNSCEEALYLCQLWFVEALKLLQQPYGIKLVCVTFSYTWFCF